MALDVACIATAIYMMFSFSDLLWFIAGIINKVGGRQESAALPGIRTYTSEHLVHTHTYIWLPLCSRKHYLTISLPCSDWGGSSRGIRHCCNQIPRHQCRDQLRDEPVRRGCHRQKPPSDWWLRKTLESLSWSWRETAIEHSVQHQLLGHPRGLSHTVWGPLWHIDSVLPPQPLSPPAGGLGRGLWVGVGHGESDAVAAGVFHLAPPVVLKLTHMHVSFFRCKLTIRCLTR